MIFAFSPGPTELIIVLVIILLLFGGAKLPKLARSLGEAKKEFEQGSSESGKGSKAEKADGDDA